MIMPFNANNGHQWLWNIFPNNYEKAVTIMLFTVKYDSEQVKITNKILEVSSPMLTFKSA